MKFAIAGLILIPLAALSAFLFGPLVAGIGLVVGVLITFFPPLGLMIAAPIVLIVLLWNFDFSTILLWLACGMIGLLILYPFLSKWEKQLNKRQD